MGYDITKKIINKYSQFSDFSQKTTQGFLIVYSEEIRKGAKHVKILTKTAVHADSFSFTDDNGSYQR